MPVCRVNLSLNLWVARLALALLLAGCAASEPKAPVPKDTVWKTLHPEQWDQNPDLTPVPPMPKRS